MDKLSQNVIKFDEKFSNKILIGGVSTVAGIGGSWHKDIIFITPKGYEYYKHLPTIDLSPDDAI